MTSRFFRSLGLAASLLLIAVVFLTSACGGSAASTTTAAASTTAESGSIVFDGLVDRPMTLTRADLDYMDWQTVTADDPTSGTTEYQGVLLSEIFTYVGVRSDATSLVITASDGSTVEITLASINSDQAIIAVADDGALSTVMPGQESKAWVEDVVSMELK